MLKVTVNRKEFLEQVGHSATIFDSRTTIEQLKYTRLSVAALGDTRLQIDASNMEQALVTSVACVASVTGGKGVAPTQSAPFVTLLRTQTLHQLIQNASSDSIDFEFPDDPSEPKVTMRSGRNSTTLFRLNPDGFPEFNFAPQVSLVFPGDALANAVSTVTPYIATDDSRYGLNGFLLELPDVPVEPGIHGVRFVATDGHRLAFSYVPKVEIDTTAHNDKNVKTVPNSALASLVPRNFAVLLKNQAARNRNVPVCIELSQTAIRATFGTVVFLSRLSEGDFPDYRQVVPNPSRATARVKVSREDLIGALSRVSLMADGKTSQIRFEVTDDGIKCSSVSVDLGAANETVDAEVTPVAENVTSVARCVGMNATYLIGALRIMRDEYVNIWIADALQPLSLRESSETNGVYESRQYHLCMPMRID
jgi:DNA polymerase-3 subunit beta